VSFFRNSEIKKSIIIYLIAAIVLTGAGFLSGTGTGIFVMVVSVLYTSVHFLITYSRYQKLAGLASEIDSILHGKENIDLKEYTEGELSILQSEILKLTVQFREQSWALKQDKIYLADSIADISHQIRTPLTSINILLSLLSNPDLTGQRRQELIKEMDILLSRIDWLVTVLLKISKLDTGTVKLKSETVYVDELIERAVDPIAIPIELRGQDLVIQIQEGASFKGDLSWSVEAIENILKNCMEHTQKGGKINISAQENSIFTEIIISDNGPGIDLEDLPHLFERFYKGKNSSRQSIGIGLALARMIITNQNGTIKAENRKEGGARFIIRFYHEYANSLHG
jgi:signal transduction histidine kinase